MRIEQLTFTRFLAAISIVIYHYGKDVFLFNNPYISFIFQKACFGVSYFFLLSGFVMIIAYGNKDKIEYSEYLKKRFARIYPAYFLAITIIFLYLIVRPKPNDFTGLFFNLFMIQSWFPGYALSFNYPGWSLSVEIFFYISFPLLFNHFYKKYSLKKIILVAVFIFIISQITLHLLLHSSFYKGFPSKSHDFCFFFPIMHFNEFLIGNIAGLIFIKRTKKENYDWSIIGLIILLGILLKFDVGINFHNGMLAFVFIPLIVLISSNNGIFTTIFNGKTFIFLGEISYGIYIFQKPIFDWVYGIMYYLKINNTTLLFFTALLILIISSAISYTFIEAPLRKKINSIYTSGN